MSEVRTELKIVRYGHPVLRQKAAPVGRITDEVKELAERLFEVMRAAKGLGLAANQVGIPRRLAVIEAEDRQIVLIDPEITRHRGMDVSDEGCLSLPRLFGEVARPSEVTVRARNLEGKWFRLRAEGLLARALGHEIDHLDGHLFIDRVDKSTLHWSIRTQEEGEPVLQPTSLEEALKVFLSAEERK